MDTDIGLSGLSSLVNQRRVQLKTLYIPGQKMMTENERMMNMEQEIKRENKYQYSGLCLDCGMQFGINEQEIDYYRSQGLALPKRCKACRFKRKAETQTFIK